ncbi:uncharacterized protein METZ01_LOCUS119308 [marine metagenome]|uniref:Uncharacterized protein n=1 Tax=marine metagenome TaxID=408172 RepID=A0A381XNW2_9ZZZZ
MQHIGHEPHENTVNVDPIQGHTEEVHIRNKPSVCQGLEPLIQNF